MLRRFDLVLCQFTRRNIPADLIFNNESSRTKEGMLEHLQFCTRA